MSYRGRSAARALGLWGILLALAAVQAGCGGPPWPPADESGYRVVAKLQDRADSTQTATYRVRWQSYGTDPHAVFFLDIAYKAPDQFRIIAEGPFGMPAFTAVIRGEEFWFLDHQAETLLVDVMGNLSHYNIPMPEFFSTHWRDLFSGGWGPGKSMIVRTLGLGPGEKRGEYLAASHGTQYVVRWDHKRQAPKWIRTDTKELGETVLRTQTWYKDQDDDYPFWKLDRIRISGFPGGGEHRWRIIEQKYNPSIPDRFFLPLRAPRGWRGR